MLIRAASRRRLIGKLMRWRDVMGRGDVKLVDLEAEDPTPLQFCQSCKFR